jgi:hypothetical protein
MRLTLRTLLAWLDDTLSPAEVREIGKQVAESPFAQELVERIQRVTRQRRLTVPGSSGPEGTDPNLVASYLDNELDQDLVPEYEKLCLTSDVHMAEVASVHQILSLIGQKAKVPNEAKNRMYHLIRGREAIAPKPRSRSAASAASAPESEPIGPWVTPPPPSRPWLARYGPAAVAALLMVLLCWSAWMTLRQSPPAGPELAGASNPAPAAAPSAPHPATVPAVPGSTTAAEEPGDAAKGETRTEGAEPARDAGQAPRADLPPGVVGTAEKPEGVLLRYNPEERGWEQLAEATPLKREDRLLGLDPFRSTLVLGPARVDLVGETEVLIGTPPPNGVARLLLGQGRLALHAGAPSLPFEIQFAGRNILITPTAGSTAGVERISHFEPGNPESARSVLRVYAVEGDVTVQADDAKETLASPGSIVWDGSKWAEKSDKPPPPWVTETRPTAHDLAIGALFLKYMRPNRKVIPNIVEAHDDDEKDVRRLSLRALRAVGDLSFVTPDLNKPDDPTSRREAIRVLQVALAQGPDSVKAVHDQLVRDFGEEPARTIEKLLVGFTPKEARDEATYASLVQNLGAADVGVRELALYNLCTLTGRDYLEYDADRPEGRGLRAWRDLLRDHELRPMAAASKGEK